MRTKEDWFMAVSAAAHLGVSGELERFIGKIQDDAQVELKSQLEQARVLLNETRKWQRYDKDWSEWKKRRDTFIEETKVIS